MWSFIINQNSREEFLGESAYANAMVTESQSNTLTQGVMHALGRLSSPPIGAWLVVVLMVCSQPSCRRHQVISNVKQTATTKAASESTTPNEVSSVYVRDEVCADCHQEIAERFSRHPMAASLSLVNERHAIERFTSSAQASGEHGPFQYTATQTPEGGIEHARSLLPLEASPEIRETHQVKFVVGSGQKGRSYLIEREDRLFMSPLTWYVDSGIWDLSPGYEENDLGFGRVVLEDCLFCHSNGTEVVGETKNHYESPLFPRGHAIGCQRCHGPGSAHVDAHQANSPPAIDTDIVHPGKLEPHLREAVCQQCHLAGVARVNPTGTSRHDFRPGDPLDAAIRTYLLAPKSDVADAFVGQVEQMYASRCFQSSGGAMGCITCHAPHSVPSPSEAFAHYRSKCLQCHESSACAVDPAERIRGLGRDDCVACHMPAIETEVRHTSSTNHRIPRNNTSAADSPRLPTSSFPIVAFPTPTLPRDDLEGMRDLAAGMLQAKLYHPRRIVEPQLAKTVRPLTQAVRRNPLDLTGKETLGDLLRDLQRHGEAERHYREVLLRAPGREHSVVQLASLMSVEGKYDEALKLWEQANAINPFMASYRARVAQTLAAQGRWQETLEAARKGVIAFPTATMLWQLRVESSLRRGLMQEAETAFAVLVRLQPKSRDQLREWFDDHPSRH